MTSVSEAPISLTAAISSVESTHCGAIVSFSGNVRSHDHGREVLSLKYEIHPSTDRELERVVNEVCDRHEVVKAMVIHRYGEIPIGEAALIVAVSAAHRQPALAACAELVDEIKLQIPIWKYQTFADGTHEWVDCA